MKVTGFSKPCHTEAKWLSAQVWSMEEPIDVLLREVVQDFYWYLTIEGVEVHSMSVSEIFLLIKMLE